MKQPPRKFRKQKFCPAFEFGHEAVKKIAAFIEDIQKEVGKAKSEPALLQGTPEFEAKIKEILLAENLAEALYDPR